MSIDMFATRTMLAALKELPRPNTFLRDTFFRNVRLFNTENVDVDIVKGKRRIAAYVSPKDEGHVVSRAGYTTNTYKAPYIKEKMVTTAADILLRAAGENIYSAMSPAERARQQLAQDLMDLDDMITRAEEFQAAEAIFEGYVTVKNGDQISFGVDATHLLTLDAADRWDANGYKLSGVLKRLRTWRKLIVKDSGLAPTDIIMGSDAMDQFITLLEAATAGDYVSGVKVDRGQIDPQLLPSGVTYWGFLKDVGCDLWSYDEYYHNGSADVAMVPAKKVTMISRNARFDRLYGVIQDVEALYAVNRFPKSWVTEDPSARWLMLQSAPLLVPHQVNGFVTATVLS